MKIKNYYTLYHYTRNFPEKIQSGGLKTLDWNQYRLEIYENIPERYKQKFDFLLAVDKTDFNQNTIREKMVHLTTDEYDTSLLQFYYGGEYLRRSIEFNFPDLKGELFEILKEIGCPLRITVRLPESFIGQIDISNLKAIQEGQFSGGEDTDIKILENIPPNYIQEILILK